MVLNIGRIRVNSHPQMAQYGRKARASVFSDDHLCYRIVLKRRDKFVLHAEIGQHRLRASKECASMDGLHAGLAERTLDFARRL
jgi:hypothetical protein